MYLLIGTYLKNLIFTRIKELQRFVLFINSSISNMALENQIPILLCWVRSNYLTWDFLLIFEFLLCLRFITREFLNHPSYVYC